MAGGNTLNLVLKRIQGHFVKMPPLNKINLKNEKKKKKKKKRKRIKKKKKKKKQEAYTKQKLLI